MRRALALGAVLPLVLAAGAHAAPLAGVARDLPTASHGHAHVFPRARIADLLHVDNGPVMQSNRTHLIFWQPSGSGLSFDPGYTKQIETFLTRVAADSHSPSNLYGLTGQYSGDGGPAVYDSRYGGAVLDTGHLPTLPGCVEPPAPPLGTGPGWTACVSDQQIQDEVERIVSSDRLPASSTDIYFLVTPAGLGSCELSGPDGCALGGPGNGYCGYHSVTAANSIPYAVIPYNAVPGHCQSGNPRPNSSTADPTISTIAHEHAEVVTDPFGNAWLDAQGNEIADLCISHFGPTLGGSSGATAYDELIGGGRYYVQELWSNVDGRCAPSVAPDRLSFRAPRALGGDRTLALRANASDPHGRIVSYLWTFGDGAGARGRRVAHVFTRAGTVTVLVRTTDSWGNWTFAARTIRIFVPRSPIARITSAPPRRTLSARPTFRFTSNAAIVNFQCRVDQGAWTPCSSPFTSPRLSRGHHTFSVRARDTFGQFARPASYGFARA